MFAVFKTGGKQYKASEGDIVRIEKVVGQAGDRVAFDNVLSLHDGSQFLVGAEAAGKSVEAEIVAQTRNDKIIVFKKKRRHNYRRKAGHKQEVTVVRFLGLAGAVKKTAKKAAAKVDATATVAEQAGE